MSLEIENVNINISEDDTDGKYLTFLIDNQLFGMSISQIQQIVGIQEITPIPEQPQYIKGIINLRGEIIPVMDMRLRIGKNEITYTERTCIIITSINGISMGVIVDEVDSVNDISDEQISHPPKVSDTGAKYITGIAKILNSVVLLVDLQMILSNEDLQSINNIK
ncbi:MAG: chemotaxis protein CheW [Oscillospiraceae bacterium]